MSERKTIYYIGDSEIGAESLECAMKYCLYCECGDFISNPIGFVLEREEDREHWLTTDKIRNTMDDEGLFTLWVKDHIDDYTEVYTDEGESAYEIISSDDDCIKYWPDSLNYILSECMEAAHQEK